MALALASFIIAALIVVPIATLAIAFECSVPLGAWAAAWLALAGALDGMAERS